MRTGLVWLAARFAAAGFLAGCSASQGNSTGMQPTPATAPTSAAASTSAPAPCPTGSPLPQGQRIIVHLVDYVVLNGVTYLSNYGRTSRPDGPPSHVVAHVRCNDRVPDSLTPPAPSEGSASFLAKGVALYATQGIPVSCELQVGDDDDRWRAYVATHTVRGKVQLSDCWKHPVRASE